MPADHMPLGDLERDRYGTHLLKEGYKESRRYGGGGFLFCPCETRRREAFSCGF